MPVCMGRKLWLKSQVLKQVISSQNFLVRARVIFTCGVLRESPRLSAESQRDHKLSADLSIDQ